VYSPQTEETGIKKNIYTKTTTMIHYLLLYIIIISLKKSRKNKRLPLSGLEQPKNKERKRKLKQKSNYGI